MNYHIVRNSETIEKIALIYNLDVIEIKEVNKHIKNFNNLVPGLRLRLPEISDSITLELNDVEPFIEDYYPKLSSYDEVYTPVEEINKEEIIDVMPIKEKIKNQPNNETNLKYVKPKVVKPIYYNPYYYPYYYYPYYNYYQKRVK